MQFIIDRLSKSYGKKEVLKNVSFAFDEGKIYGLLGRNGAGKTTLFNCLNGDIPRDGGEVCFSDGGVRRPSRPEDIGYVNLHGTGTRVNDAMEAQVISQVFPHGVKVSSTKSITGHTLGAAGAFGTVISAMCLASSQPCLLPPHVFDGELDETIPQLDFVKAGQRCEIHAAISNAFAFGGSNSLLLMEVEG